MMNYHLWKLWGNLVLVAEQIGIERNEAAKAKGQG
jgi:hypothetical protein